MKLKRRDWILAATAVAVPTQSRAQAPDLIEETRAAMRANRAALLAVKLPMAVEPAFVFKV